MSLSKHTVNYLKGLVMLLLYSACSTVHARFTSVPFISLCPAQHLEEILYPFIWTLLRLKQKFQEN